MGEKYGIQTRNDKPFCHSFLTLNSEIKVAHSVCSVGCFFSNKIMCKTLRGETTLVKTGNES